jgi:prepilin-type N-terminal cleavage/methylation domain-containing protein
MNPKSSLASHSRGSRINTRKAVGFTMIEVAITLVLVAIMSAIALPGMRDFLARTRLSTQVSSLRADVAYARSEAARQNVVVSLCPAAVGTTGGAVVYTCSGTDWSIGWIAFVDSAGTTGVFDSTDTVLRVHNKTNGISISGSGGLASAASLTMRPTGEASVSGKFDLCIVGYPITSLVISGSGRSGVSYASAIATTCP